MSGVLKSSMKSRCGGPALVSDEQTHIYICQLPSKKRESVLPILTLTYSTPRLPTAVSLAALLTASHMAQQ